MSNEAKKPTAEELKLTLDQHKLYLETRWSSQPQGKCADLRNADLRNADLRNADLSGAVLSGADLRNADLRNADLSGAVLRNADLSGAVLSGAVLRNADLRNADLRNAVLSGAVLRNADLSGAVLRNAVLSGADLRNAVLRNADLRNADLRNADLRNAVLSGAVLSETKTDAETKWPHYQIVPSEGDFIAWKKVRTDDQFQAVVLKLLVPAAAKRTASLVGRKCRASKVKVLEAFFMDGTKVPKGRVLCSRHDSDFKYRVGRVASEKKFDGDARVECTTGIHFFITRAEAEAY